MDKDVSDKGEPAIDVVRRGVKVKYSFPEGIDKSHITKTTMRVRRPEDSQSQELEGDIVNSQDLESPQPKILRLSETRSTQMSPVATTSSANSVRSNEHFMKPVWPEPKFDEYHVHNTPMENCNWANSARSLKRIEQDPDEPEERPPKPTFGVWAKGLRSLLLPALEQDPTSDYAIKEEDWPVLIQVVKNGPGPGIVIVPGTDDVKDKSGKVLKKGAVEVKLQIRQDPIQDLLGYAYQTFEKGALRQNFRPVCTYPNCLGQRGTEHDFPRCYKHRGVPKYGVKEFCHTKGEIVSFYSHTFSYSVSANDSPKRRKQLFDMAEKNDQGSADSGWASYKKEVKGTDYTQFTLFEDSYHTAKEAENQLAVIQTIRLLAKMAGSKYEGKEVRILNKQVALSYKCEVDMVAKLRSDHKIILRCKKSSMVDPKLPEGLGRRSVGNEKPGDGEAAHYLQGDGIVLYSGKKDGVSGGSASRKMMGTTVREYEHKMENRVTDYPFLINTKTLLTDAEHIVNFSVYLGHLFKCKTPSDITNDNFICLNKLVKGTSVIDKWPLICSFSQHFFKVDFSLEQVQ